MRVGSESVECKSWGGGVKESGVLGLGTCEEGV